LSGVDLEWGVVPSVCRRIAAWVVVACLGVTLPAHIALAQSTGDATTTTPGLTETPQPAPQTPTRTAATPAPAPSEPAEAPTSAAAGQLPDTGLDAGVLLLLGAALLLGGLGLRLRSAPERF
jgi:LPXTG-motif cell wall-anchored protein